MGFMENLRRNAFGVFGTIILFILLILFVWSDASQGGSNTFGIGTQPAGYVNGDEITFTELDARVDEVQAANPGGDLNRDSLREQVWTQLVQEKVLFQAASEYGIAVSDEELRTVMFTAPPQQLRAFFTDSTGTFLRDQYVSFMSDVDGFLSGQGIDQATAQQIRQTVLDAERQTRLGKTFQRLLGVVGSLLPRSTTIAKAEFNESSSRASGRFLLLSANLIPDDQVTVGDDEVAAYYEENRSAFRRPASRSLQYAMVRLAPSGKDSSTVRKKFEAYLDKMAKGTTPAEKDSIFGTIASESARLFRGRRYLGAHELPDVIRDTIMRLAAPAIIGPVNIEGKSYFVNLTDVSDSGTTQVKASHILIGSPDDSDSLKAIADGIASSARAGSDWTALVTENSQDPGSAQNGGDVGWVTKQTAFVPEFKTAVLGAKSVGQIIGPVKSQFGYHIIKVTGRSTRGYKLRALNFDVQISGMTRNQLKRKAQTVQTALEEGTPFEKVAADLELQVLESGPIYSSSAQVVSNSRLASFAYESEVGDVSDVLKMPDESHVVAILTGITPAGPRPLEEAKGEIEATLRSKKKVAMLADRAAKVRSAIGTNLNDGLSADTTATLRDFADVTPIGTFADVGSDAALASTVFSMSPGEISKPVKGTRGYYIVQVDSVTTPTEAEWSQQQDGYFDTSLGQGRQFLFGIWFQNLLDAAEVSRYW